MISIMLLHIKCWRKKIVTSKNDSYGLILSADTQANVCAPPLDTEVVTTVNMKHSLERSSAKGDHTILINLLSYNAYKNIHPFIAFRNEIMVNTIWLFDNNLQKRKVLNIKVKRDFWPALGRFIQVLYSFLNDGFNWTELEIFLWQSHAYDLYFSIIFSLSWLKCSFVLQLYHRRTRHVCFYTTITSGVLKWSPFHKLWQCWN